MAIYHGSFANLVAEHAEDPAFRRQLARERLQLAARETVLAAMAAQGLSRADLAARLGVSRARVSQMLGADRNLTLATLSDLAEALNLRVTIETASIEPAVPMASRRRRRTGGPAAKSRKA